MANESQTKAQAEDKVISEIETESETKNEANKGIEVEEALSKNIKLNSLLDKIAENNAEAKEGKPLRILSIDGGGVRGIIPTMVLNYIEKKTKKPISSLFDIITGTSTGALLGVVLNIPNEKGSKVPKYNTDDALNLYMKECPALFQTNFLINLKNLWGLRSARYSST
ncbi:FabD/lysophospholipase-like protein, partial [Neoconidiobolus thromboides FSU 785]